MSQKRSTANKCGRSDRPPPQPHSVCAIVLRSGDFSVPPAKRTPSVISLQRELQLEREKHRRTQESVEQLRMEMQMMGRLLASTREQLVALGAESLSPDISVLMPQEVHCARHRMARLRGRSAIRVASQAPSAARPARPANESRHVQRLQEDLAESKTHCKRLHEQAASLQHKNKSLLASKKELANIARPPVQKWPAG